MLDFLKRIIIALAIGACIGILFIGTNISFAQEQQYNSPLNGDHIWPTMGELTDSFGTRGGTHYGIDIAAPEGTLVMTIADGVVRRSYYSDSYGHVVFVQHQSGLETVYAHLNQRFVSEGDAVREGEEIGTVGNTGRSSGNHLHFEVHKGEWNLEKSNAIDPFLVIAKESSPLYVNEHKQLTIEENNRASSQEEKLINEDAVATLHYMDSPKHEHEEPNKNQHNDNSEKAVSFTVQEGDTLWSIANHFGVGLEALMEWNELESSLIISGDVLTVFVHEQEHYQVQKGDTLSSIAEDHALSVALLKKQNDLTDDLIFPGDVLCVERN
ncbi:M23 family metallopeptidase [Halalkalibacterium ligniniphilum]|uniref:M23 family metallopeptidase n=1 Tax=Halalkalibacterium ligniniphilum TaxID=1134413 RepID=UPI0003497FAD|nr:M23 family metallopeptidase [Halalkalibacterium ligniniphilum]